MSSSIPIRVFLAVLVLASANVLHAQDAELVLRCTAITPVPDPADVDYEDCLTTLRFEVERKLSGTVEADTVVGVFWGMRFGKKSPAAALVVGDRIQAKFVMYVLRAQQLEKYPRLDKTKDFESPVLYATEWKKLGDDADTDSDESTEDDDPIEPVATTVTTPQRSIGDRIRAVLAAHGGETIGGPLKRDTAPRFFEYEYLYRDRFWEVPAGVEADGPLAVIIDFHRQLEARGVRLHVAFVPCAAATMPGVAARVPYEAGEHGRIDDFFQEFAREVAAQGVASTDCLPTLLANPMCSYLGIDYPAFLIGAPYWAPWAAAECARTVARDIRAAPDADRLADWGRFPSTSRKTADRVTARLIDRFGAINALNTLFERVVPDERGTGVLLDRNDGSSPIWVLGDVLTSTHSKKKADFASHLAAEFGLPVRVYSTRHDDPHEPRRKLCDHGLSKNVKLVVWQISVPTLADPTSWNRYEIAK